MTSNHPTPATAAPGAVDVAKLRNKVLIEVSDARRRRRSTVTSTRAEHDRLIAELHALGRPVDLEPTGHHHRPLAWRLVQAGFDVRPISSVALARTPGALHNGWVKNDPQDAQVILRMLRIGAADDRAADPERGRQVNAGTSASCHGDRGQDQRLEDAYAPLVGPFTPEQHCYGPWGGIHDWLRANPEAARATP